ncbi:MAG TPA: serine hydrolase domain-containing protein [Prolixibacteraceae bacterium]|nr:serine hydrolase domain-containing protein [Prolixibacteraceae bacterium]HPR59720.1 serine hydrolase domain-containing protein [Prolixibacteraceae bacterium]
MNDFLHMNFVPFAKRISIVVLFLVSLSCQRSDTSLRLVNNEYKTSIAESREIVRNFLLTSFSPGISVSVSLNNEIVWSEGAGLASKELNAPVTRQTKFKIGNTAQTFTAAVIALLQQQGKLNVDSSFYAYIPNYPQKDYDFTLRMLGAHSAGLQPTRIESLTDFDNLKSLREYVKLFDYAPLVYEPDTYFQVSDYAPAMLGIVAEQVSGKHYYHLMKEMLIDSLGLTNTTADYPFIVIPNRSEAYTLDYLARLINATELNLTALSPVHGLLSTADDLNHFACQLLSPGFFTEESINLFSNSHILSNGAETGRSFGWMVFDDAKKRKIIAQLGNTIGGSSSIIICPEYNLVVTACTNKNDGTSELPAYAIAQVFLNHIAALHAEQAEEAAAEAAEQQELEELFGEEDDETEE